MTTDPRSADAALLAALGIPGIGRPGGYMAAVVGAGGKTSLLYALARALEGRRVLLTTTTRMRDPRGEAGRPPCRVLVEADEPGAPIVSPDALSLFLAAAREAPGKLVGVRPERADALKASFDIAVVEADGARGLSIKAPSSAEPVVPALADAVAGVIGLDCLGAPLGPEIAHRPELLCPLAGCRFGEPLRPDHIARLAAAPEGLFKGAPPGARRVLVLNKADAADPALVKETVAAVAALPGRPGAIVVASLRDGGGDREASIAFESRQEAT